MPDIPELYPLLRGYSYKNNSAYIDIEAFLEFLAKYATHKATEDPEWNYWLEEVEARLWKELTALTSAGKCVVLTDSKKSRIYLPAFFHHQIQEIYSNMDKLADQPFPNGNSLRISIPENHVKEVILQTGMDHFFEKHQHNDEETETQPERIISLVFPQDFGSALLLESMIPRQLMDLAFLKIRHFLRTRNNKDYILNKLIPQLPGKEKYLREIIEQVVYHPHDCLGDMEKTADFPYLFWTYFCSAIKKEMRSKSELIIEDIAALQAVCVIEVCGGFFRARAAKLRETDVAFNTLDVCIGKPPWYFTLDDITNFTNDANIPLLQFYSRSALEDYIQKKITQPVKDELPAWLVMHGSRNERWFLKKEKYLFICSKMLIEAHEPVKKTVIERWIRMIKEFRKESAMEHDEEFDRLLASITKSVNPLLTNILDDAKLFLVYEDLDRIQGAIPKVAQIYNEGRLLPLSSLYAVRRKDTLASVKLQLPFWYTMPLISTIVAFIKNFGKKKNKKPPNYAVVNSIESVIAPKNTELRQSVIEIQDALLPQGKAFEEYLSELEDRWSRLLDQTAKQNLVRDVKQLVRDNLNSAFKLHKAKKITRESLSDMAGYLIENNSGLRKLGSKNGLRSYIELYMVKLLLSKR